MKYKHFILTRFNLPLFESDRRGNSINNLDSAYLLQRMTLFEQFCAPSLAAQTSQDYEWLLLFDAATPHEVLDRVAVLCGLHPNWHLCLFDARDYLSPDDDLLAYLSERQDPSWLLFDKENDPIGENIMLFRQTRFMFDQIRKRLTDCCDYILVTRHDNDDSLARDYIATVSQIAQREKRRCLIDFVDGCQYIQSQGVLLQTSICCNHFTTLVQPLSQGLQTPLLWNHTQAARFVDVLHVGSQPMWLEVVHASNVLNGSSVNHRASFVWRDLHCWRERFGLDRDSLSASFWGALALRLSPSYNWGCLVSRLRSVSAIKTFYRWVTSRAVCSFFLHLYPIFI